MIGQTSTLPELSHRPKTTVHRKLLPFAALMVLLTGCSSGIADKPFYDASKPHHGPEGFLNPPGTPNRDFSTTRFLGFAFRRLTQDFDPAILPDNHVMPRQEALFTFKAAPGDDRITWIGHATMLIGLDGLNVLTDPFFSERASPLSFIGPKRYMPPGLPMDALPPIDVILISHNHYDSLDTSSLRDLLQRSPKTRIIVPLGLGSFVRDIGYTVIDEVDWFDEVKLGKLKFMSTPGIHRSNRSIFDSNQTLWTGFVIEGPSKRIWFSGDTGYGPAFKDWIKRIGNVDLA
ncbi:MAG: MBL fold metallo-hydrolase, partial [Proteobacteria bacterium]|nr:MBL fold metallo-hydrolase [Pseudomonadota bacterium]